MDPVVPGRALIVTCLGLRPYKSVWHEMQAFTDARHSDTNDEIWLVEHPPVFTLGQAGSMEHVLAPGKIPVVQCDRGGQVTYHGPGQAVIYPLIDLRRMNLGIKSLVHNLEQAVIDTLAANQIESERRVGAPGVYVQGRKIASIGLRVRRGCTFHGMAFNIDMDLEPFHRINPCGFEGLQVTQLSALGGTNSWQKAARQVCSAFGQLIQRPIEFSESPVRAAQHG